MSGKVLLPAGPQLISDYGRSTSNPFPAEVTNRTGGGSQPPLEKLSKDETLRLRKIHIGFSFRGHQGSRKLCSIRRRRGSCSVFFKSDPLKIVRGQGQYMFDELGHKFLDCINNVAHVGHCHPHVVEAGAQQMALLSTNSRYLHDNLVLYAQRLTDYFPNKLSVCYFVNSGSEANDLALRLARAHTKQEDVVVLDGAYHGHLTSMTEVSPYKFLKMVNKKKADWVHVAPLPCAYRGALGDRPAGEDLGALYAQEVQLLLDRAHQDGRSVAAFLAESMVSCGGQVVLPPSYLRNVYRCVRAAGGVTIADEVQTGFGRVGSHMWAFQQYGEDVVPDIVTVGKPIGNGHPVAAVITTPEIALSFQQIGVEYFNTYGGNPVSLAIASAVLDVIEKEKLREHALEVGNFMLNEFQGLRDRHSLVGDVRGCGMFLGLDLVRNRTTKEPASLEADYIVHRLRERQILLSTEGKYSNVLKFKPPMVFTQEDGRTLVNALDSILSDLEERDSFLTESLSGESSTEEVSMSSD